MGQTYKAILFKARVTAAIKNNEPNILGSSWDLNSSRDTQPWQMSQNAVRSFAGKSAARRVVSLKLIIYITVLLFS